MPHVAGKIGKERSQRRLLRHRRGGGLTERSARRAYCHGNRGEEDERCRHWSQWRCEQRAYHGDGSIWRNDATH